MSDIPQEKIFKKVVSFVYRIPNPLRSEEDYFRLIHQDLDNMTKAELCREYGRVEWCLKFVDKPHNWLIQRGERLRTLIFTKKKNEK